MSRRVPSVVLEKCKICEIRRKNGTGTNITYQVVGQNENDVGLGRLRPGGRRGQRYDRQERCEYFHDDGPLTTRRFPDDVCRRIERADETNKRLWKRFSSCSPSSSRLAERTRAAVKNNTKITYASRENVPLK